jgi:hypothetical protein
MQVGLLRALDTWLLEDHARVEHRLVAPQAVGQLVELFATACRQRDMATMPQMLDSLKLMLSRWGVEERARGRWRCVRDCALVFACIRQRVRCVCVCVCVCVFARACTRVSCIHCVCRMSVEAHVQLLVMPLKV